MIDLTRHIEALLLSYDCVIIPGLGGFVSQYVESYYIEDEKTFFPPYRTVGFNPQLTINDGLLVQSVMQTYDVNYPEAQRMIEQKVEEIQNRLHCNCAYDFEGIGVLTINLGGVYSFKPFDSGVIAPKLYGLNSFQMKKASEIQEERTESSKKEKRNEAEYKTEKKASSIVKIADEPRHYTISVNKTATNYIATIAAAVLLYFIFSIPTQSPSDYNVSTEGASANGIFIGLSSLMQNQNANKKDISSISLDTANDKTLLNEEIKSESTIEQNIDKVKEDKAVKQEDKKLVESHAEGTYVIVLASAVTEKNAEIYVSELKKQGMPEAFVYKKGKMTRVLYSSYPTEEEAKSALNKLCSNDNFSEAWVMQLK